MSTKDANPRPLRIKTCVLEDVKSVLRCVKCWAYGVAAQSAIVSNTVYQKLLRNLFSWGTWYSQASP